MLASWTPWNNGVNEPSWTYYYHAFPSSSTNSALFLIGLVLGTKHSCFIYSLQCSAWNPWELSSVFCCRLCTNRNFVVVCSFVDLVRQIRIRCSWTIDDAERFKQLVRLLVYGSAYIMSGPLLVGAGSCNIRRQAQFSENPSCGRPPPPKFYAPPPIISFNFQGTKLNILP